VRHWSTTADAAELDLLLWELVEQAWPHRGKPGFEAALAEATEAVLAWRRGRELRTVAARLRAQEDLDELERGFEWGPPPVDFNVYVPCGCPTPPGAPCRHSQPEPSRPRLRVVS
jgi:hypothetical protein